MNNLLNKILCKYFSDDGIVTINSLLNRIIMYIIILIFSAFSVISVIISTQEIFQNCLFGSSCLDVKGTYKDYFIAFGITITSFCIAIFSLYIFYKIKDIEITRCEKDNKKE